MTEPSESSQSSEPSAPPGPRRIRYCRECGRDLNGLGAIIVCVVEEDVPCHCMNRPSVDHRTGVDPRGLSPCMNSYCNTANPMYEYGCEECNFTLHVGVCRSCNGQGVYDRMGETRCVGDERGSHDNRGGSL